MEDLSLVALNTQTDKNIQKALLWTRKEPDRLIHPSKTLPSLLSVPVSEQQMLSFIKKTEFDLTAAEPFGVLSFQLSKILKLIQEISQS